MSDVTPPLRGRRILVTGGATGIGAAAVGVLTEAGATVTATYHQTPPPDDLVATWLQCDVRDARKASRSPDLRKAVAIEPCSSNHLSLE